MRQIPEPSAERRQGKLVVEVPRLPSRSTLRKCRARAKVIAAREGVRTEPEVSSYDDRPSAFGGPMRDPRGTSSPSTFTATGRRLTKKGGQRPMADPGCDFEDEDGIASGKKPTQRLTLGMTPPEVGAGVSGWAGVFQYGHHPTSGFGVAEIVNQEADHS